MRVMDTWARITSRPVTVDAQGPQCLVPVCFSQVETENWEAGAGRTDPRGRWLSFRWGPR